MKVAMVLPGLHTVVRGAEVAFESIAQELAQYDDVDMTLFGSGQERPDSPYKFQHIDSISRKKFESSWPRNIPLFRDENNYEEFTFMANLFREYDPNQFDISIACSYPFANWFLMWKRKEGRPAHIFVTQNSDYMVYTPNREFRFFNCDGLVCTNPQYFERNKNRPEWLTTLIPNGVDPNIFNPGPKERQRFQLPEDLPVALMVSALIEEKRVLEGIKAAAQVPNLNLVICGDGPLRKPVQQLGEQLMPGRFHLKKLPRTEMPYIYRTADLFLHMSLVEPSANAYIEALASGLPIVTHDREVTRWTLEDTAVLIDASNLEKVTTGIQTALATGRGEANVAKRIDLVNRRFSWRSLAQEYHQFFTQVLAAKKPKRA